MISIILPYYNRKQLLYVTLESFVYFYSNESIEVVIVDDCSDDDNRVDRVDRIESKYPFPIRLIRINNKNGINPCLPYNVGVRQSTGNIIVLTSPETLHTKSMFETSNDFKLLNDTTYLQFSVFCLTKKDLKSVLIGNEPFNLKLETLNNNKKYFYNNLGEYGYPFNNSFGSWYTHSIIRPSCLNFMSALTRKTYYRMGGFDERFRFGTGFDDEEFRNRILKITGTIWYDDFVAVHIDHEAVGGMSPTTNEKVFINSKRQPYQANENWGIL
jgi:glycosyltransferase involved in cell wall biosynthesis